MEGLPDKFKVLVITMSDRAYAGTYDDLSGPLAEKLCGEWFYLQKWPCTTKRVILPDDSHKLREEILSAVTDYDVIITTGGTGIGPRDITVETIRPLIEKEIPVIMDYIRIRYGHDIPNALLSRSIAGTAKKALIFTLPGSVRAVEEYLNEIFRLLRHLIYMLHGIDTHRKDQ